MKIFFPLYFSYFSPRIKGDDGQNELRLKQKSKFHINNFI